MNDRITIQPMDVNVCTEKSTVCDYKQDERLFWSCLPIKNLFHR